MPSWNIHLAHVEHLLNNDAPQKLGIQDINAFVFGNVVPDIYVGYVVPSVSKKIAYKDTHLADPLFVPMPDAARFYELYVRGSGSDSLAMGAWTHLLCDHYYNLRTNQYIERIGVKPGERTRIRKQADFELFGRTLHIKVVPEADQTLVDKCASFAPYHICEQDVRRTVDTMSDIVRKNAEGHVSVPQYDLLDEAFFSSTYAEVNSVLRQALLLHVAGDDPTVFGRP